MDEQTTPHPFDTGLDRHPANFVPLSPVSFLRRAVASFRDKTAVIDGDRRFTYGELNDRCSGSHPHSPLAASGGWTPLPSSHRTFPRWSRPILPYPCSVPFSIR